MSSWLESLTAAGIDPDIVTPDYAVLPLEPGHAIFVFENDRIYGVSALRGFAIESSLADILETGVVDAEEITQIIAYGNPAQYQFQGDAPVEWRELGSVSPLVTFASDDAVVSGRRQTSGLALIARKKTGRAQKAYGGEAQYWRRRALRSGLAPLSPMARVMRVLLQPWTMRWASIHATAFPEAASSDPARHARQILNTRASSPQFLRVTNSLAQGIGESESIQVQAHSI